MNMKLEDAALRFIALHQLIPQGATVICAVSGGADSTALLHFLHSHRERLGVDVEATHVNHRIAEARSDEAEACVRAAVEALGIPLHGVRVDVPALARREGIGVETAGRRARHRWYRTLCRRRGGIVATAHTADDQAETVLMRILRGTGTHGLAGIRPTLRHEGHPWLVRPFLDARRADTREYVDNNRLAVIDDPTNLDPGYGIRNKLRNILLPLLVEYNPAVVAALCRLATAAQEDAAFIDTEADAAWRTCARTQEGLVVLGEVLRSVPTALRVRLYQRAVETLIPDHHVALDANTVARVEDLLNGAHGRRANVAPSIETRRTARGLEFRMEVVGAITPIGGPRPLAVPGESRINGWAIRASVVTGQGRFSPRLADVMDGYRRALATPWLVALDASLGPLTLRRRVAGERWRPTRGSGSRKLKATLNAWGVPPVERDAVPIIAAGPQLACLPGWGVDARCAPAVDATEVIQIEIWFEG